MTVIPPYSENAVVSPTSMDVVIDDLHFGLGDIVLPEPVTLKNKSNVGMKREEL